MIINRNTSASNAYHQLKISNGVKTKSAEKLSSGLRINRSRDDAAGLSISEKMRGQIRGLGKAFENAQDGIFLVQTAEGALKEIHSMLQRIREVAVQTSNPTHIVTERISAQEEINQLVDEIDRIAKATEHNTQLLLRGDSGGSQVRLFNLQIGANHNENLLIRIESAKAIDLNIQNVDISDAVQASQAITMVDKAIEKVSSQRSQLGAFQNRLEHTLNNLGHYSSSLDQAESRIRNTDIAKEMLNYTKSNIMEQAAQTMSAQSNHLPEVVLDILRDQ